MGFNKTRWPTFKGPILLRHKQKQMLLFKFKSSNTFLFLWHSYELLQYYADLMCTRADCCCDIRLIRVLGTVLVHLNFFVVRVYTGIVFDEDNTYYY